MIQVPQINYLRYAIAREGYHFFIDFTVSDTVR